MTICNYLITAVCTWTGVHVSIYSTFFSALVSINSWETYLTFIQALKVPRGWILMTLEPPWASKTLEKYWMNCHEIIAPVFFVGSSTNKDSHTPFWFPEMFGWMVGREETRSGSQYAQVSFLFPGRSVLGFYDFYKTRSQHWILK